MPQTTTARSIIEQARIRHPAFSDAHMPDGALLLFLNQRQRSHLLASGDGIGPLVAATAEIATTIDGVLVGSENGVPTYLTSHEDGWPVFLDDTTGVPYFDFTGPKIAGDPFGESGGTLGFPLPDAFIKLVSVVATYESGATGPVDIVHEKTRHDFAQGRNPAVFVTGNRLIPVLPASTTAIGGLAEWADVTTLTLSYIGSPTLTALTSILTVPDALVEALVADVAHLLAMRTPGLSASDRAMYRDEARTAAALLAGGSDLVGDATSGSVTYSGT